MNPFLRSLEDWSTHQDYWWFLAVLAWGGVLGAELRRRGNNGAAENRWIMVLAASQMTGALLELVLLAQDLTAPYLKFDLAMGAAQACGTGAMMCGATIGAQSATLK